MMSSSAELAVHSPTLADDKLDAVRAPSPVPTATSSCSEHSLEAGDDEAVLFPASSCVLPPCDFCTADFVLQPPPLRANAWAEACATDFMVRTRHYTTNQIKSPSEPAVFRLLTVDLVKVHQPIFTGLCSHPAERIQMALRREQETGSKELPAFIFAVNLCIPGKSTYHWVAYFGLDDVSVLQDTSTPLGRVAKPFFFGDCDDYRDKTFKLIPRIVEGNVVVRKAVGSKPTILGSKVKQYYIQSERFFEIVVDIGSEKMAQRIVRLAQGYAKNLVVDMMFVLEGVDEETLPERVLAGARVCNLDFKQKDGQRLCPPATTK